MKPVVRAGAEFIGLGIGAIALALLFTWRLWTPVASDRRWIRPGDFSDQFFPWATLVGREIGQGRLPLWNPHVFSGFPFGADPQVALFYPVSTGLAAILGRNGLSYRELQLEIPLHLAIAALGALYLCRRIGLGRLPSLAAGLIYGFGGFLTSYPIEQLAILRTAAWIPWLLWAVEATWGRGWHGRLAPITAVSVGVLIVAGHTQTAMFGLYLGAAYAVMRSRAALVPWMTTLLSIAAVFGLGLGVAAIQIVPGLEFVAVSTRDRLAYDDAAYGYSLRALPGVLVPGWRDERALYVGIGTLGLIAAALHTRRAAISFFAVAAALSLLLSVGGNLFSYDLLFLGFPFWGAFRDQERLMVIWNLAAAVLAAYGIDRIQREERAATLLGRWFGHAGIASSLFLTAVLIAWTVNRGIEPNPLNELLDATVLLTIVIGLLIAAVRIGIHRGARVLVVSLLIVLAFDLFSSGANRRQTAMDPDMRPGVRAALDAAWVDGEPFRVRTGADRLLPPNWGIILNTEMVTGDGPIQIRRMRDLLNSGAEWRIWQLTNTKFLIDDQARVDPGLEERHRSSVLSTYAVRFSLPRVWAVSDVRVVDPTQSLQAALDSAIHPGDTAILEAHPAIPIAPGLPRPETRILDYSPNRVTIRTDATGNALLVVADAWYPAWRASVDGVTTPILVVNHAFRGVAVPAGVHEVILELTMDRYWIGGAISLLSVLGALTVAIVSKARTPGRGATP